MQKAWYWIVVFALTLSACSKESNSPIKTAGAGDPNRGRGIYLANCVACHSNDPGKDGPLGPAIRGASKELVEARVLRASYPPGYKPKRMTKVMPAMPYLKNRIPDLTAFLNQDDAKGVS